MPAKPKTDPSPATLRRRAEKLVTKPAKAFDDAEARRLLHELEVHQIELEMQNAALREARDESEVLLEKYTELYDFAPVGYFTLTPDGIIRLANLTGSTMVGIGRANLVGRSFAMLLAHVQRAGFRSFLKQVFKEETKQSAEFELGDPNLATRVITIEARRCPTGSECRAMILDITARREALEKMRISEIRHRLLFEAAQDGILLIDAANGRIIDANPFMTRLLGFPRQQLIGKELFEIGLLKDEVASRRMFRELRKSHEIRYENLPMQSRAGRRTEVEVVANLYEEGGRPLIQCNIRDITARKLAEEMSQRNVKLKQEIARKEKIAEDLQAQRNEQSRILKQTRAQQKQLRDFSHRILNAQEQERKRISRELHDIIAQTLVGINVHLAVLNQTNAATPAILRRQVSKTQTLVKKAIGIVHDFARELRPTMLDDLGLIPALKMHMERFMADTGIRVDLNASAKVDRSPTVVRTALYRIAIAALTNVARHSKASHVVVNIKSIEDIIRMTIRDDGEGFQVTANAGSRKKNRLGLLGMKERAEMIGGTFNVESAPGEPTTVMVEVPVG